MKKLFYLLLFLLLPAISFAVDAFPGAEGPAKSIRGAYGGAGNPTIYVVDTLLDDGQPVASDTINGTTVYKGSIRACWEDTTYTSAGQGRIITFGVAGVSEPTEIGTNANSNFITVAGESAPYPGFTMRVWLRVGEGDSATNWIIRHIKWRPGNPGVDEYGSGTPECQQWEAWSTSSTIGPWIIDHCSISWTNDELWDFYNNAGGNFTITNNIFSEPLAGYHEQKGSECSADNETHRYGPNILGKTRNILIARNLWVHIEGRNPLLQQIDNGFEMAYINNVWYNWTTQVYNFYLISDTDSYDLCIEDNYWDRGPQGGAQWIGFVGGSVSSNNDVYVNGNYDVDLGRKITVDTNWSSFVNENGQSNYLTAKDSDGCDVDSFTYTQWDGDDVLNNLTANTGYLTSVGAWSSQRDSIDTRLVNEVTTGGSSGEVMSNTEIPSYGGSNVSWDTTSASYVAPSIPANPHADSGNGYTNLEIWLQGLAAELESSGPVRSAPYPTSQQACGSDPQTVSMGLTTGVNATCKYDTSDVAYASMANTFDGGGTTSHSKDVSQACDGSTVYYVRCTDGTYTNSTSLEITVDVAAAPPPPSAGINWIIGGSGVDVGTGGGLTITSP